jgi:sarcosine oxidase delta subunit
MEDFNSQDSQEIMKNFKSIIGSRLEKLDNEKGADGELYAYSIAVANQKKKKAKETQPDVAMENSKLREMVIDALTEKKKSTAFTPEYDDKFTDKRKDLPDGLQKSILKKQGKLDEDMDLGHEDDEPNMIKADLYQIGKYAMKLYKIVDQFDNGQEVDFPHWWQSKIITAKNMISSAKHYLEFELKEPELNAMVDVASEEGAIDENIDGIDYRNRNNVMMGIYDLAEKSKDVESFKEKWYKTYSRGLQDKDADTDEWLETIFRRVNKSSKSIDEKLKPSMGAGAYVDDFRKSDAPQFDNKSKAKKDKMAVAAFLNAKAKAKIKEAILAKLKEK